MVGTTDQKCEVTHHVEPPKEDMEFIINELKQIFGNEFLFDQSLMSAWAGIRPLVKEFESDRKEAE